MVISFITVADLLSRLLEENLPEHIKKEIRLLRAFLAMVINLSGPPEKFSSLEPPYNIIQ